MPIKTCMVFVKVLLALVLSSLALIFLAGQTKALEGVGALADRLGAVTAYTLHGKTAPWAEVVIVDPEDPVQVDHIYVTAELEPSGTFEFTFRVSSAIYPRLQMFGVDEAGDTSRILLPVNPATEILLPPTIINDLSDNSTNKAALTGFTFPGATVSLTLNNLDSAEVFNFNLTADGVTGRWRFLSENLTAGAYWGVAISHLGGLVSEKSQEIFFTILAIPLPPVLEKIISPIINLIPGGAKTVDIISKLAVPAAIITSGFLLTDLFAFLLRLFLALLNLLGFRRNRRSWGVIYDAVTKRPLERCIVRLYDEETKNLVETDVTDSDGVFSFLPREGRYRLKVSRSGYIFPSVLVRGSGHDGEYENLYHGEVLIVQPDQTVSVSIPLDPAEAVLTWRFRLKQTFRQISTWLNWVILFVGVFFSLYSWLAHASLFNLLILLVYLTLLVWSLIIWRKKVIGFGQVLDRASNKRIGGVGVSLYDLEFNRLVQRRVSDETGRFQLVVPPGTYRLDIVSADWILDVNGPGGFRGQLLTAKGKRTTVLKPTLYVQIRSKQIYGLAK